MKRLTLLFATVCAAISINAQTDFDPNGYDLGRIYELTGDGVEVTAEQDGYNQLKWRHQSLVHNHNDKFILFTASDATNGDELWKSDGTAAGTAILKDINPGAGGSSIKNLTSLGDKVFFIANDGTNGIELWVTDGTAAGTKMAANIHTGAESSEPRSLAAFGSKLIFSAIDADGVGDGFRFPYVYDPATETATRVSEYHSVWPDGIENIMKWGTECGFQVIGTAEKPIAIFFATDPIKGREICKYEDGGQVQVILDINQTPVEGVEGATANSAANDHIIKVSDNHVFFRVETPGFYMGYGATPTDTMNTGQNPWITDGTVEGTYPIDDINKEANAQGHTGHTFLGEMYLFKNKLHWATVGTGIGGKEHAVLHSLKPGSMSAETYEIWDINGVDDEGLNRDSKASVCGIYGDYLVSCKAVTQVSTDNAAGNRFNFNWGIEPWYTDGTEEGQVMISDVNPGPADLEVADGKWWNTGGSNAAQFVQVRNLMYVSAKGGSGEVELYAIAINAENDMFGKDTVVLVHDFDGNSNPHNFVEFKDELFFTTGAKKLYKLVDEVNTEATPNVTWDDLKMPSESYVWDTCNYVYADAEGCSVGVPGVTHIMGIVYPNPASDQVFVKFEGTANSNYRIYSMAGAMIETGTIGYDGSVSVDGLNNGTYLMVIPVEVQGGINLVYTKFVISR
jgi:ELWxxDGT repeat protein